MGFYHAHGVFGQPPLPHRRDELPCCDVVGKMNCTIFVSGIASGHTPVVQQVSIALLREGWATVEILPEFFKRACVVIPQRPHGPVELGQVGHLEKRVSGMGGKSTPQVRAQHGSDHSAIAAARLASDTPVLALRQCPVMTVDPGDYFITQVGMVATSGGRSAKTA